MSNFVNNDVASGAIVYAADHNTQGALLAAVINGGIDDGNIAAGANIQGSKLADSSINLTTKASTWDGWVGVTDAWTYASATTITVPTDATQKYSVGDKIKLTQTTVKYFYIVGVAATTLTITGGTDYTLANAAISSISYSKAATPLGFPESFATSPTIAGFSVNPTSLYRFNITGRICNYWSTRTANGTSNATTYTVTTPVTSANVGNGWRFASVSLVDNGAGLSGGGMIVLPPASNTLDLRKDAGGGVWTAANAKGADFAISYAI